MSKLTPINKAIKVHQIAAFDTETYADQYNTFRMGSVIYGGNVYVYWNKEEMADDLIRKIMSNYKIFATNLQFDWNVLWDMDDDWQLLFNASKLIKAYNRKTHVSFLDSINIAPISVKKMGEAIGLPKLKLVDNDFAGASDDEIRAYNIRDSEITYHYMVWFQKVINKLGGELKATLPATSMDIFRRKYLNQTIFQPNKLRNEMCMESYYGGRTEVYVKGFIDKPFNVYDINSMYPFSMLKPFPDINLLRYEKNGNLEMVMENEGCSKVDIFVPYSHIPPLPYRYEKKLLFPCGFMSGVYTHPELRYLVNECKGKIIKIHWSIYSPEQMDYFSDFVVDFYEIRMEYQRDNNPAEYPVKINLNGLYGKFATKTDKPGSGILQTINADTDIMDLDGCYIYDDKYYIKQLEKVPVYVIPLISAYITAYSRILLHKYICTIRNYYTDTDCLFTPDHLDISSKLGDLKLEYRVLRAWIFANKMYVLITDDIDNQIIKCKGIPFKELDDFYEVLFTRLDEKIEFHYDKFIKMREGFRRHLLPNQVINYKKTIDLYGPDKRIWNKSQFNIFRDHTTTTPFWVKNNKLSSPPETYI